MSSQPSNPLQWEDLDQSELRILVKRALQEDFAGQGLAMPPARRGDVTSQQLDQTRQGRARFSNREPLVMCGLPLIPLILEETAHLIGSTETGSVKNSIEDGTYVDKPTRLVEISGPVALLLTAERVLLNFIQHLSGVATLTMRYVQVMGETRTQLLDTRKTTPGYRYLEKYAVGCGGGKNHRLGLFDRILIKDNHLAAGAFGEGNSLTERLKRIKANYPDLPLEVEVDHLAQVEPAIQGGADFLMLDNFSDADTRQAIIQAKGRIKIELSGGITLENLAAKANLGADYLSTGAIVHQSVWPDIGLDWATEN